MLSLLLTATLLTSGLYRNDAYGVTLSFPKDVSPEESTDGGMTMLMAATPSKGILIAVLVDEEEWNRADGKPFAPEQDPFFADWLAGFEHQSAWRPSQLQGAEAARVLAIGKSVAGHALTGEVRAARRGHLVYGWLACGQTGSGFERGGAEAKRYLDSLRLVAPGGPVTYRDEKNGFRIAVPPRWQASPASPGQSELLRLVTPAQRMAAMVGLAPEKVPAKLADPRALGWLESAFKQGQPGYQRISARRTKIAGATAFDYWFTTQPDGKRRAQGARMLRIGDRMLMLVVFAPGAAPDAKSVGLLESFAPLR
jgi:hypothetical protein